MGAGWCVPGQLGRVPPPTRTGQLVPLQRAAGLDPPVPAGEGAEEDPTGSAQEDSGQVTPPEGAHFLQAPEAAEQPTPCPGLPWARAALTRDRRAWLPLASREVEVMLTLTHYFVVFTFVTMGKTYSWEKKRLCSQPHP